MCPNFLWHWSKISDLNSTGITIKLTLPIFSWNTSPSNKYLDVFPASTLDVRAITSLFPRLCQTISVQLGSVMVPISPTSWVSLLTCVITLIWKASSATTCSNLIDSTVSESSITSYPYVSAPSIVSFCSSTLSLTGIWGVGSLS